jgi:hypothetical protein
MHLGFRKLARAAPRLPPYSRPSSDRHVLQCRSQSDARSSAGHVLLPTGSDGPRIKARPTRLQADVGRASYPLPHMQLLVALLGLALCAQHVSAVTWWAAVSCPFVWPTLTTPLPGTT